MKEKEIHKSRNRWLCVDFLISQMVKILPAMWEIQVQSLGKEDTLEKEIATHSSILAWEITWTEEPGGLQSMGSQRVEHDSAPIMKGTSQCKILFL